MASTPEFTLLVEACRASFERRKPAAADLNDAIDWPRFLRLARFHRVQGLVWQALGEHVPRETADELARDAQAIAEANLRSAVECRNLSAAFDNAGIPFLFVKGLTLAVLAYGTISTKSAIDIDVLVWKERVRESATVLQGLGYRLDRPSIEPAELDDWHRIGKESVWAKPGKPLQLDLHTRLADNRRLIPGVGLQSPRQAVEVSPGVTLATLDTDELFAYLCVHGASSAWFRLKWITDLAAFLSRQSSAHIDRLYQRSEEIGAGRAAAQALLLADALYGSLTGLAALRERLAGDRPAQRLFRAALKQLAGKAEPVEPTSRLFGTARIHLSQFALSPGWRFKLSEIIRQARVARA